MPTAFPLPDRRRRASHAPCASLVRHAKAEYDELARHATHVALARPTDARGRVRRRRCRGRRCAGCAERHAAVRAFSRRLDQMSAAEFRHAACGRRPCSRPRTTRLRTWCRLASALDRPTVVPKPVLRVDVRSSCSCSARSPWLWNTCATPPPPPPNSDDEDAENATTTTHHDRRVAATPEAAAAPAALVRRPTETTLVTLLEQAIVDDMRGIVRGNMLAVPQFVKDSCATSTWQPPGHDTGADDRAPEHEGGLRAADALPPARDRGARGARRSPRRRAVRCRPRHVRAHGVGASRRRRRWSRRATRRGCSRRAPSTPSTPRSSRWPRAARASRSWPTRSRCTPRGTRARRRTRARRALCAACAACRA